MWSMIAYLPNPVGIESFSEEALPKPSLEMRFKHEFPTE